MSQSNVLIIGLRGLGVEIGNNSIKYLLQKIIIKIYWYLDISSIYFRILIFFEKLKIIAKNVILAGVKSVTLYDPELTQLSDLSSQVSLNKYLINTKLIITNNSFIFIYLFIYYSSS